MKPLERFVKWGEDVLRRQAAGDDWAEYQVAFVNLTVITIIILVITAIAVLIFK